MIRTLLPAAGTIAEVVGVPGSGRLAELSARFQAAAVSQPEWFAAFIADVPDGEPLPYHENFGLTPAEYEELLVLLNDAEWAVIGTLEIGAASTPDEPEMYAFTGGNASDGYLDGFTLDLRTLTFDTPFGIVSNPVPFDSPDLPAFVGPAHGWQWELGGAALDAQADIDPLAVNGSAIEILLLITERDGRVLLDVTGGTFENGLPTAGVDLILLYTPPG